MAEVKFIEATQSQYDSLIPNEYTFYNCTDTKTGYLGSKQITNENINSILHIEMYFCLWDSGIDPPPANDELTAAICGTAICGLTICGLSDTNEFWSTKECYTIDGLYKWMKYSIEYYDGTTEEMGPYCLTDYYTRETLNNAVDNITLLQDKTDSANEAIEFAQTTAEEALEAAENSITISNAYTDERIEDLDKTDTEVSGQYVSAVNETNGIISVSRASLPTVSDSAVSGQYVSAVSENAGAISVTRTNLPDYSDTYDTKGAADTALTEAKAYADTLVGESDAMVFKGTLGTGGTVTAVPTSNVTVGDTYKVITEGTWAGSACKVGDLLIALNSGSVTANTTNWAQIPSGDEETTTIRTGTSNLTTSAQSGDIIVGDAAAKNVDSSIATSSTSTNLPTSAAVVDYITAQGYTTNTGTITGVTTSSPLSGSGTSGTVNIGHNTSGATAGTYGPTAAVSPSAGGTFSVPSVTVDTYGHVTSVINRTVTLPTSTSTATNAETADVATKLGTATVGSVSQPIYLSSGTATALTSTVGSVSKPVFMSSGAITALTSTIGSASIPVYMSSGAITACTNTNDVVKSIIPYFCLWSTETPPNDEDLTPAICGTAVCGTTVCGVTDGVLWKEDEPADTENLYKWIKWHISYKDGTEEWTIPYKLTDVYLRNFVNNLNNSVEVAQSTAERALEIAIENAIPQWESI